MCWAWASITLPVWWKTSLDWTFPFPRSFWAWAVLVQKSVTWNSDSPLGVRGQPHGSGQSVPFPALGLQVLATASLTQPMAGWSAPSWLHRPAEAGGCLFYTISILVCLQIGLLAVYLVLPFPKLLRLWPCAAAPCPALSQRFFPFHNPWEASSGGGGSTVKVTAAVAEPVPCSIMWVVLSHRDLHLPFKYTARGGGNWWWGRSSCNV